MPVLLDTGANVNMITPECVVALGLQMGPLMDLCEGGITINQPFNYEGRPRGSMKIKLCLWPSSSTEFTYHVPIILGTPTMD